MNSINNNFYSGTSGLVLPIPQSQYPPSFQGKSRLTYFASLFNSVEINSSFYKPPKASTITKWAESVPGNFRFTFKLSKAITHAKALDFNADDVECFMQTIDFVGKKKGCLLIQFPPALKIEKFDQLQNLLSIIKHANSNASWKVAIEFRNTSWYNKEVYHLLDQYNASLVIHDIPASATPQTAPATGFKYLRFHGPLARYRGSYDDTFLLQYGQYIKAWLSEGKTVYAYFNNTMGDAVKNLQALNSFVQQ
ncbi:MAG TPA: DUF72 domain-containing protein [Chitinophagaceae bacterium]|nr:DUF72 domain-containing protein [Chitinophagaceae bacterium]